MYLLKNVSAREQVVKQLADQRDLGKTPLTDQ
jgi:hypothetical protein